MREMLLSALILWVLIMAFDNACGGGGSKKYRGHVETPSVTASAKRWFLPYKKKKVLEVPEAQAAGPARLDGIDVRTLDPAQLIKYVSIRYDVPAGALYGIWMKESRGLRGGWGSGWLLARDLTDPSSLCVRRYGQEKCDRWWEYLHVLCGQMRADGSRVCDPRQVRASYAMALGPMQILPTMWIHKKRDGSYGWLKIVVDLDGDGVIDPHSLPDAMATAAKLIRKYYDQHGNWPKAVNCYYGSQMEGYYEGTDYKIGVMDYWRRWCDVPGNCGDVTPSIASR